MKGPSRPPAIDPSALAPSVASARAIFQSPEVLDSSATSLAWTTPDYAGLTAFLVGTHSFNEQRVSKYIERLKATRASGTQTRLDAFFRQGPSKGVPDTAKFDAFARKPKAGGAAGGAGSKRAGKQPLSGPGGKKAKR